MNYVAIYLLRIYPEKDDAYKAFKTITKHNYSKIFGESLDRLRLIFYMFDNFLSFHCPELAEYMKVSSSNNLAREN